MNIDIPGLNGHIEIRGAGDLWWIPDVGEPRSLTMEDSFCGAGLFSTGPNDPFYKYGACPTHDEMYQNRAYWESQGWDRDKMDRNLLILFLGIVHDYEDDCPKEKARAHAMYAAVRCIGWVFYYRHPGYDGQKMQLALADVPMVNLFPDGSDCGSC